MYKDVWKKFGAKIFIVVCSVLLLGGVAIAAPKMRAAGKISLSTVTEGAIRVDPADTFIYGKQTVPEKLIFEDSQGIHTITAEKDYEVKGNGTNGITNAGKTQIIITARSTSDYFNADYEKFTVEYTIQKAPNPGTIKCQVENTQDVTTDYLPILGDSITLQKEQLKVWIELSNGSTIDIKPEEYDLDAQPKKGVGKYDYSIVLHNYITNSMATDPEDKSRYSTSCVVKRHVKYLRVNVTIDATTHEPRAEVFDGDIRVDTSSGAPACTVLPVNTDHVTGDPEGEPSVKITGNPDKYYVGEVIVPYTVNGRNLANAIPVIGTDFSAVKQYDESVKDGTGYKQAPSTMKDKDDSGNPILLKLGEDYKIGGYAVNGTAGNVSLTLVGLKKYAGTSAKISYSVSRDLANATFTSDPPQSEIDFVYDKKTNHSVIPHITYSDSEDPYELVKGSDYEISYVNHTMGGPDKEGDTESAGTITMTATGKGSKENGGYYGAISLEYAIKAKEISKEKGYELRLKKASMDTMPQFEYTGKPSPVVDGATIVQKVDGKSEELKVSDHFVQDEDYTVEYQDNAAEIGQHTVRFVFAGNYTGYLEAKYNVYAYTMKGCTVVLGKCDQDCCTGSTHVYNGKKHTPEVKVYKDSARTQLLPEGSYTIDDTFKNTDSGQATVRVIGKASASDYQDAHFTINKKPLDEIASSDLKLPFTTTEFAGHNAMPELPKVTWNDIDLTFETDYKVIALQGSEDGTTWTNINLAASSPNYPRYDASGKPWQYRYQIEAVEVNGKANYTGKQYTDAFTFTKRDLASNVTCVIPDSTSAFANDDAVKKYAKENIKVKDNGLNALLIQATDENNSYDGDFAITSCTSKNGIVTVEITGHGYYDGVKKDITFNIGKDISKAIIYENGTQVTTSDTDGRLWFTGTYAVDETTGTPEPRISFVTSNASAGVCLRYLSATGSVLKKDVDYVVDFGRYEYMDDGKGNKYGSIIISAKDWGNYYGNVEVWFKVGKTRISECDFTVDPSNAEIQYTGFPIGANELKVTGIDKKRQDPTDATKPLALTEGTHYTVRYENHVNVSKDGNLAKVYVSGLRDYEGETKVGEFKITPRAITDNGHITLDGLKESYLYTRYTEEDGKTFDGVRPVVTLTFTYAGKPETLVKGKDYTVSYENNESVGTAKMIIQGIGNFTDKIEKNFKIVGIDLERDCDIKFSSSNYIYTGAKIEPDVVVRLKETGKQLSPSDCGYQVRYEKNIAVGDTAVAIVEPDPNASICTCTGQAQIEFTIKGDFNVDPASAYAGLSGIAYDSKEAYVFFDDTDTEKTNALKNISLTFWEKNAENKDNPKPDREKDLVPDEDYDITCKLDTVGIQTAKIIGKGIYKGTKSIDFTVKGDLSKDYTECTVPDLTYVSGQEVPLGQKLKVVCGNKLLKYGEDYEFEGAVDSSVGTHSITIRPTSTGALFLESQRDVDYTVRTSIAEATVDGVATTYEYRHGLPVITESDITVKMGSTTLTPEEHYTVSIKNAVNCTDGGGSVTITGKNEYTGEMVLKFKITPFDINSSEMKVNYDKTPLYTGKAILPDTELTIYDADNTLKTLVPNTDYELVKGDGDSKNYTKADAVEPTFKIRGMGNYTGTLTKSFAIQRRSINPNESDVISYEKIADQSYKNGTDIQPVPVINFESYGKLAGKRVEQGENLSEYEGQPIDFVYSYEYKKSDVGVKRIKIQGINNFKGDYTLAFNVIKKNIEDADVTVEFVSDTMPVYDGTEQHPKFKMMYDGICILEYDGQNAVSDYMAHPQVSFNNAIDVTDAATILIEAGTKDEPDPNYEGQKQVTFSILPMSLADERGSHVRFMYYPFEAAEAVNLDSYEIHLAFNKGNTVEPKYAANEVLATGELGVFYNNEESKNNNKLLIKDTDYTVAYEYVEPDTQDTPVRNDYKNPDPMLSYAGKVKVTVTGQGNYTDSANYWYYIGKDISAAPECKLQKSTTVFNAQEQKPVETVSGVAKNEYKAVWYRHAIAEENIIHINENTDEDKDKGQAESREKQFFDADTYYLRIEGDPREGTYASAPKQLIYTITPRNISHVLIDGYKTEYSYTGNAICPVGITVTDYIDDISYKLTEGKDYSLSYSNNTNAGTASMIVKGQGNYDAGTSATAKFRIISSTISGGNNGGSTGMPDGSSGQISGSSVVTADDVRLSLDMSDAMNYTGSPLYPGVYIQGMTENVDYVTTYSNNINVGQGTVVIRGINNNSGTIIKTFRIVAPLSKCSVSGISDQNYTGSAVTPVVTVRCGSNILTEGTDYTVSYVNNVNIGTASVIISAAANSNYTGSVTVNFGIGNSMGSAVVTGYASHYTYTGKPITPGVNVTVGTTTLRQGTDYTVAYANNTNAGTATITVHGKGKYAGTQTVAFTIDAKNIQTCTTTNVSNKKYTGDAYTPSVTVSDGTKTLTNGIDYTVTYSNNRNPGTARIVIQGQNKNYAGTKVISFRIATVAVTRLKATSVKSTSMVLSWKAQSYADGYQICDSKSRVIKNVAKNRTAMTGLASGKTYRFKVRSYIRKSDGTRAYGSFSTVVGATTKLKTPSVKIYATTKGQARITWTKVAGASGYELYYSKSATGTFKKLKTTKNTVRKCTVKGLRSGERYFFRVRAYKKVGSKKIYGNFNSLKAIKVK